LSTFRVQAVYVAATRHTFGIYTLTHALTDWPDMYVDRIIYLQKR